MSRLLAATVLVCTMSFALTAPASGSIAGAKDPKTAKALAGLLAAKKLGCTDFASATTSSGLPAGLDALAGKLKGASIGTCTIDGHQTLLVAFKNGRARKGFETTIRTLPCLLIKVLERQLVAPASGAPAGSLSIPLVDVRSKALVFATGTAPGADQLDLAVAAATDAKVAAGTKGTVRSFSFTCP